MKKSAYSDWILKNFPAALKVVSGTSIFPEVLLAQAIIESAKSGKMPGTILAREHNNYFGIKAGKNYSGSVVNMMTGEFSPSGTYAKEPAYFRKYSSPEESFRDYVKLLHNKRYRKALAASTPDAQALELQLAGYSTNPKYGETVAALANTIRNASGAIKETIKKNPGTSGAVGLGLGAAVAAALYFYSKR